MTSTDYDIRAAIREVVETSDLSDPADIAEKIVGEVPAKTLRSVLGEVLPQYVRTYLHTMPRWRQPEPEPKDNGSPISSRSAKVGAIRAWARVLRKPVAVEANVWKSFGECDTDDLAYLAADRRQNAAESIAAAQRFEKYSALLDEHGAETVADLPDSAIASIEDGGQ